MNGYDLDNTLADTAFSQANIRGLKNVYLSADVMYRPRGDFVVLTGRRAPTAELRKATRDWLKEHFPNCKGVFFYSGGERAVAKAKAGAIKRMRLDSYTDDNLDILKMIREEGVTVPLYHYSGGSKKSV